MSNFNPPVSKSEKSPTTVWSYIIDHPRIAGVVALLALAATFSPKASIVASYICIVLAFLLLFAFVVGEAKIKTSKCPRIYMFLTALLLAIPLGLYALWLTPPAAPHRQIIAVANAANPQSSDNSANQLPVATKAASHPAQVPAAVVTANAAPIYSQKCEGSACAQGPNSQATYNQYGPPKYRVDLAVGVSLTKGLSPLAGKRIGIFISSTSENATKAGNIFVKSAGDAGMEFEPQTPVYAGMPIFGASGNGICISFPNDRTSEAEIVRSAITASKMYTKQINRCPGIKEDILGVYISTLE